MIPVESSLGFVGLSSGGHIVGWAWHTLKTLSVDLYIDGEYVSRHRAKATIDGLPVPWEARGACFSAKVNKRYFDGRPHDVDVRVAGEDQSIPGAPKRLIFSHAEQERLGKIVEINRDGLAFGWVTDPHPEWSRPVCRLVFDGQLTIDFQAGNFGKEAEDVGDGIKAFKFQVRVPPQLRGERRLTATLLVDTESGWERLDEVHAKVRPPRLGSYRPANPFKRLIIADPSLRSKRGHGFGVAQKMVAAAQGRFDEIIVLANKKADPEWMTNAKLIPQFSHSLYDRIANDGFSAQLDNLWAVAQPITADLGAFQEEHGWADALVFYPTVNHIMAEAVSNHLSKCDPESVEHHMLLLMLESGLASDTPDGQRNIIDTTMVASFQRAFKRLDKVTPDRWSVSAISETMAQDFDQLSPVPVGRAPQLLVAKPDRDEPGKPFDLGLYLGEIKQDKGFMFTPDLIQAVVQDHPDVRMHVQAYCGTTNLGAFKSVIDRLSDLARQHDNLIVYDEFMEEDDYEHLMAHLDAAVVAYDPTRYAGKTSGVYWESESLGIPVVCPGKTWISHEAQRNGIVYYPFNEHTMEDVRGALLGLLRDRPAPLTRPEHTLATDPHARFLAWMQQRYGELKRARTGKRISAKLKQAAESVWMPRYALVDAARDEGFIRGFGDAFVNSFNVDCRWMGETGLVHIMADRCEDVVLKITGQGSKDRRFLHNLDVLIDGQLQPIQMDVQNKSSWVAEIVMPARASVFAEQTVVDLVVNLEKAALTPDLIENGQAILISKLETYPLSERPAQMGVAA